MIYHDYHPGRVIQIVSGSRSGSTLLKSVLSGCPGLESLAGEEEPYVKYSCNGYGHTSDSDATSSFKNTTLFRQCITTELLTDNLCAAWDWRLRLQFTGELLAKLLDRVNRMPWKPEQINGWLDTQGVLGFYDGCAKERRQSFDEMPMVYEMPPYVRAKVRHSDQGNLKDTLLLKSPYKVYRPGALEHVYPHSRFHYIVLIRNPAAIINGLVDGWEANYGFHKHQVPVREHRGNMWWKFDLPPGWTQYASLNKTNVDRAWYQWYSSYKRIADGWIEGDKQKQTIVVRFDDLVSDPHRVVGDLCHQLNLAPPVQPLDTLPKVMTTEVPRPGRWRTNPVRAGQILEVLKHPLSQELIRRLGIDTDPNTWM